MVDIENQHINFLVDGWRFVYLRVSGYIFDTPFKSIKKEVVSLKHEIDRGLQRNKQYHFSKLEI